MAYVTWKQQVLHRTLVEGNDQNHAEHILIQSSELNASLKDNSIVTLCLTFNPCHLYDSKQSCVNELLQWYHSKLKPQQIKLEIVCVNLFRVHWTRSDRKNCLLTQQANHGLNALLAEKEIQVRGMTPNDWAMLIRHHCSAQLLSDLPPIWTDRLGCDKRIDSFLSYARRRPNTDAKKHKY